MLRNVLLVLLMSLGLVASSGVVKPSDERVLFFCPKAEGVCFWSKDKGWEKIIDSSPEGIVEFERAPDGRVVVLLRGHGNPGKTLVVTPDGRIQAVQSNHVEGNLERVAGFDAAGRIVLCSETPEIAHCDVFLPGQTNSTMPPFFPENCLFPRILTNGSRACLRSFPHPALLLITGENNVQEFRLPERLGSVDTFHLLAPSRFLLQDLDALLIFDLDSGLTTITEKRVLWSTSIKGKVYFATYAVDKENTLYTLREYAPAFGATEIWKSDVYVPSRVQEVQGGLLLDVSGKGQRHLIFLPGDKDKKEEILWTESSALWQ